MPNFRVMVEAFDILEIEDAKDKDEAAQIAREVMLGKRSDLWEVTEIKEIG